MVTFAVIQTGGKQYVIEPGKRYKFEKIPGNAGDAMAFDRVLLTFGQDGAEVRVGTPTVPGVTVVGKVLQQGRSRKIEVIKYKAKSRYRRKYGHRQHFTEVEVTGIQG